MVRDEIQDEISKWLKAAGREKLPEPGFPSVESFERWLLLMEEELEETKLAFFNKDWEEFRDGICDIKVVTGNIIYESALDNLNEHDMNAVFTSLWSKFDTNEEEAAETKKHYESQGVSVYQKEVKVSDSVHYIVTYRNDGKILKSKPNFKEPEL